MEWVEDEAVVLHAESGELHYLNRAAALVYALILEHGFDEGMAQADRQFGSDPGYVADRDGLIADMVERGLLLDD